MSAESELLNFYLPAFINAGTRKPKMTQPLFYRPEDYGVPGSGLDDAPLIQQAINAAEANNGGTVMLASRQYNVGSTLMLSRGGVTLAGNGWGAGPPFPGSWLHVTEPEICAIRISGAIRNSAILRDFAIRYDPPSLRCDNPHFSNLFFLPYFRGLHFGSSLDGSTSKFRVSQLDCDFCRDSLYIDGAKTTGKIVNFTSQGTNLGGSTGMFVNAGRVKMQICNFRVTDVQANAIRVQGNDSMIAVENTWIDGWSRGGGNFPAIEAVDSGSHVILGKSRWFFGGGGAPITGGNGQIEVD